MLYATWMFSQGMNLINNKIGMTENLITKPKFKVASFEKHVYRS